MLGKKRGAVTVSSAEDISVFINAVCDLCGVGICYYDLSQFFNYDRLGVRSNRGHYCAFCELTRTLPGGRAQCEASDKQCAVQLAAQYREPFFFECHMGMRELVIPLLRGEKLLGIVFVGQCRLQEETGTAAVEKGALRLGGDPAEHRRLYEALPLHTRNELLWIGKILSQYFESKILNRELLSPRTDVGKPDTAAAMRDYIETNYRLDIAPGTVAEAFFLNPSYASRCFSQRFGTTLGEYICQKRLEHARLLLRSTTAPISSIALNVGYPEPNYFSRIFKKHTGLTPQEYRTQCRKLAE